MSSSKIGVRVIGFTTVLGALAVIQACAPAASEDPNVDIKDPGLGTEACGALAPCPPKGGSSGTIGGTDGPPRPPANYKVRYSRCDNYIEGDAKIRNNSRIAQLGSGSTIAIMRVEPIVGSKDNVRRVPLAKVKNLLGGTGKDLATGKTVYFVKLGQVITTKATNGDLTQWVVSSQPLGEPYTDKKDGRNYYRDTCFRNPKLVGKDTAGRVVAGEELASVCIVEESSMEWNALSVYGYSPLVNYADTKVATFHDPYVHPHPDSATWEGKDAAGIQYYSGYGAALNDINGTERDGALNYIVGENYCHMIVAGGGYEVPGSKRPATKSMPAPGVVNGKTYVTWRPVNPAVDIANQADPPAPDPVEPEPEIGEPIADADTIPL